MALRVLIPLDGSGATYEAVERGLAKLAGVKDAQALFFIVIAKNVKNMPPDAREYLEEDEDDELFLTEEEAGAAIEKAQAIAKRVRFARSSGKIVEGQPYDAILKEARSHDVLVMHALDRDEYAEKMRGGVLEKLCRNAPCDVWLVRTG
jgi:nucleotide-binding universal stress UspA family protein